jgi:hypothetical protein
MQLAPVVRVSKQALFDCPIDDDARTCYFQIPMPLIINPTVSIPGYAFLSVHVTRRLNRAQNCSHFDLSFGDYILQVPLVLALQLGLLNQSMRRNSSSGHLKLSR